MDDINNIIDNEDIQSINSFHTAVGEVAPVNEPHNRHFGPCYGSSCVWITFCAAIILIFILVVYVTEVKMAIKIAPYIYLMLLMCFAAMFQLYYLCRRNRNGLLEDVPVGNRVTDLYVMAGLYMFGAGTLMSILLELSLYLHSSFLLYDCSSQDEPKTKYDGNVLSQNNQTGSKNSSSTIFIYGGYCRTFVAYNIFRLLFVLIQLGFIHSFRHSYFQYSSLIKFILYQTSLTNVCIWFKYVSDETGLFGQRKPVVPGADGFVLTAESLKDKLNPFILEFSLIAAGIFINISSNMHNPQNAGDIGQNAGDIGQNAGDIGQNAGDIGQNGDIADGNENILPGRGNADGGYGTQPGLLTGACCGLTLVTLAIMFDNSDNKLSEKSKAIFLCYESFLSVFQTIVLLVALYYVIKEHRQDGHTQNKWDYFLLAAAYLGTLVFDFVVFYGVSRSIANNSKLTFVNSNKQNPYQFRDDIMVVVLSCCLCFFHGAQMVVIIIYFRRYGPRLELKSAGYVRQCLLFLISTNLGSWALDSFIEIRNHVTVPYYSASENFQGWQTLLGLSFPFCVFFRFHSALLLFEFWQRFKFG